MSATTVARTGRWLARLVGRPLAIGDRPRAADAIVVLGCPVRADGSLSPALDERVRAGVLLWKLGLGRLLVLTGGNHRGDGAAVPEAVAMARRAAELGVPTAALRIEQASTTTYENARRCRALLAAEGVSVVWVVTQPFHLRRARFWFRRAGFTVLAWHIEDSLQYESLGRGVRWVVREYASWVRLWGLEVRRLAGRGAG